MNTNFPRYPTEPPRRPSLILPPLIPPSATPLPQPPQMGVMPTPPSNRMPRPQQIPSRPPIRGQAPMANALVNTENLQPMPEATRQNPEIRKSPFGTAFSDKNRPR